MLQTRKFPSDFSRYLSSAFALTTIRDRLPVILVKTLDDLVKYKSKYGNPENNSVISEISKLRYEIMTNKPFAPLLPEPEAVDIAIYNETCSLWSNEFDLSLKLRSNMRAKTATQMVVDDLDAITNRWPSSPSAISADHRRIVVIVMDNTPPEMFADLVLSEFLLSAGLAERIIFMPKIMPWFVSDVTQFDFDWLLKEALPGCAVSQKLASWAGRWSQRFHEGSFALELHAFWTLPFGYNELQTRSPALYRRLTMGCDVVIFKGDLNYRKLVEDRLWDKVTAFQRCFLNSLSDVAVGLTSARLQAVCALDPQWWVKGLFGFAQLLL
ncbi:unnamed protein product [Hydatigera taeniaeformis]|uniref:Sugar phosphate phosphatase n=1 Tax=Hydatigena taeniaeformis TaxID=6205 RepID=A0A0R3WMH3_HYDTA|nr:unnamed protein product [Hydatigera taeniaeformis]